MSEPREQDVSPGDRAILLAIERACDAFEAAWQAGQRPAIEEFLVREPEEHRARLLEGLLEIELELRRRAGDALTLDQYRSRFPGDDQRVEAAYRRVLGSRRLGDYELLDELGRGGMGEVYRARQVHLHQIVALKLLPERYLDEPQAISRFRREMKSIGGLEHPNIVRAYNAGEAEGRHFLVMEYVAGTDLQRLVEREGEPLSVGAACEVIRQAALGLQHAHEHGLVHRDIKPANLMLSRTGEVKILDFGLARFQASQLTQQLSQVGLALGTVDYMAPEQGENSSTVDIRADIYSLGCTLYFLLTAVPPYTDSRYDTLRKKLMAHAVAPVPSLLDVLPDCPEDLDRMLSHMLAKEPDERFDTPGEVADAVGLLADPEALAAYPPDMPTSEQTGVTATPKARSSAADTARRMLRHSPSARKSTRHRRPWYRHRAPWAVIAGVLLLAAWGGGWWLSQLWQTPGPSPATNGESNGTPASAAENGQRLAAELALLPGLNGHWWFEEMPWYLPCARQALAGSVAAAADPGAELDGRPTSYLDPNVAEAQRWLWDAVARCDSRLTDGQRRLIQELKSLSATSLKESELASRLEDCLRRFSSWHPEAAWPAADLHARALLQHKLATMRNDREQAQAARASYEAAAKKYAQDGAPAAPLQLLCYADAALLWSNVLRNHEQAKLLFDKALPANDAPVLFAAATRVDFGVAAASAGQYEDHLFLRASALLDECGAGKRSHPLAARVCEGHAWSLMDQWKVGEAAKRFQEASSIRLANKRAENPFAPIYVFHNRHGAAIALRYRGNPEAARRVFKTLVGDQILAGDKGQPGEIQTALEDAEAQPERPGQQTYLRDLQGRWANSMERWADCELYGGAASGAPVNLVRARALYEKARSLNRDLDLGTSVVMTCKLCLVQALHGQVAEASQAFDGLQTDVADLLGPDRERAALLRQVAEAVLRLRENPQHPAEGQKALRGFLDQLKLQPSYTDSRRRETLELQLFCAELLLTSALEAQDVQAAQHDLKYLEPLLSTFRGRKDMRPFLRRYYDLAIRAGDRSDLVQVAQYLLEARSAESQEALPSGRPTLLLFHFTAADNVAIFLPQDGRPGRRVPLALTREQIKEAASRGQQLHLNDELVTLVRDERRAGRPVEVSWSDTMCWASEDEGLADTDWPFGEQLDLANLSGSR